MSVKITTSNYEEFYLDFLEGNLSGDVLLAFEAFLAEHPDLAVSEDALFVLEPDAPEEEAYGAFNKLLLKKQVDISELSGDTIDYFLISSTEGLLSAGDERKLSKWLDKNPQYKRDAAIVAATRSEADLSVVFDDKESLKRKTRIIPMWWSGVAAAAAAVLLIVVFNWNTGNVEGPAGQTAQSDIPADSPSVSPDANNTDPQPAIPQDNAVRPSVPRSNQRAPKNVAANRSAAPAKKQVAPAAVGGLEIRKAVINVQPAELATNAEPLPKKPESVKAREAEPPATYASVDQMASPISPVIKAISNKLDTPVDFRTAKANNKKGGGFYLKLGKLEVSHTTASMH